MITASAPTRLDFGGGWTDVPPFPEERGGFVCNLAIDLRASVSLALAADSATHHPPATADTALAEAARRRALQVCTTPDAEDRVRRAAVELQCAFPVGAGLGGSSAVGVALAAAFGALAGSRRSAADYAELSRATEVEELGVAGGFQDHYAAAFGGALGLSLGATRHAEPLPLAPAAVACLERRLTLVYTGESRISAETITAVLNAYAERDARVVRALDRMADLARQMADALSAGDISGLAELVDEHWVHQQSLHPRITTDRIQAIERAVRHVGATGFKALGASGGGCVVVFSSIVDAPSVRDAAASLGTVLPWRVSRDGVRVARMVSPAVTG